MGPLNAITDVAGVRVGHTTLRDGAEGPFNTGVTAILPHDGDVFAVRVAAAFAVLNGSGEVTGGSSWTRWACSTVRSC